MKSKLLLFFSAAFLAVPAISQAQNAIVNKHWGHSVTVTATANRPGIAAMKDAAVAVASDRAALSMMKETGIVSSVAGNEYINACIEVNNQATLDSITALGGHVGSVAGDLATVQIPVSSAKQIADLGGIERLQLSRKFTLQMDDARTAGNVGPVINGTAAGLSQAYTGKGVVVGVVDQGLEYDHNDFYNTKTGEFRVKRVWEQDLDTTVCNVPKYNYGYQFTTKDEILAKKYDIKSGYHGTHVTGIAAGGDFVKNNPYYGIASDADIVLVSCSGTMSKILDGVKYICDYADSVGKPCVINLSWGSSLGPHDGTSESDRFIDAVSGPGHIVTGAAGNNGDVNGHIRKTFSVKDPYLRTGLTFQSYSNTKLAMADFWGEKGQRAKARVFLYDITNVKEVASTDFLDISQSKTIQLNVDTVPGGATDTLQAIVRVYTGTDEANNCPYAEVVAATQGAQRDRFGVGIEIMAASGTMNAWCDGSYSMFTKLGIPDYVAGDNEYSVSELGGTGKSIISVGSFNTKNVFDTYNGNVDYSSYYPIGDLSGFSSLGPTVDGRVKPDICAPGAFIISAFNKYVNNFTSYFMGRCTAATTYNDNQSYYRYLSGTSMASPFVAGVIATWLQYNPTLTPDQIRTALQKSAKNDSFTGSVKASGSTNWGYGKVDATAGLKYIMENYPYDITGITAVTKDTPKASNAVYSITGQYMGTTTKGLAPGLYVTGGKKIVVK